MEPEAKDFLKRVVWSLSAGLLWLMLNMTMGIYFDLLFIRDGVSIGNIVFYLLIFYFGSLIYLALGKLLFKSLIPYPIYEEIFVKLSISPQNLFTLLQSKITSKSDDA